MLPDEHEHAPGGGDAEDVQQDRLRRQQQRAERPRQQDERRDRDQGDHQREAAVDRVDEVGVRRRLPAHAHVRSDAVRRVPHARRAWPRPRRCRCPGSGSPPRARSRRGATAGCPAPRRRGCPRRRPTAFTTSPGSVPPSTRISCGSSAPSPMPASSSATRPVLASPDFATVSASELPSWRSVAANTSASTTAMPAAAAIQRRRATISAQRVQARLALSSVRRCGQSSRGPSFASTTGQQRDRHERRDERDQHPAVAHRAQERQRQRDQREQADRHGDAAEHDRAPGGLHRLLNRLVAAAPVRALLAPARDDDQRVVDRHTEPEQRDQELHDRGDRGELGEPEQQQERGHDRDDRHEDRDDRQERREHEREHRERAEPAEHRLEQQAGALAVRAAVLEQRVEAGQVHRLAGDRGALQRRARRLLGPAGSHRRPSPGRAAGRRARRSCGRRSRRRSCRPWRRRRRPASPAAPSRAPGRPSPGPRLTPGESALVPSGSFTTGTSGIVSPPVPAVALLRSSTFVSQPSLLGTENSGSSASVAGPDAATPAMVSTTQASTTVRLCARTQRVSEDNCLPPA